MSWRRYFQRAKWDQVRRDELESYIQLETDDNIARGMSPDDARAAAQRKLGNATLIREEIYTMNTVGFLESLGRDLRQALRMLRRNPAFTVTALLTLAIGIGATTAVFSVVNSVLLKPLAYPNSDELVAVRQEAPGAEGLGSVSDGLRLSASMYYTYAEQNRSFQSMGVWAGGTASVTGLAEPERVRVIYISDGLLQTFAVRPAAGRWLTEDDQKPNGPLIVMLSYGYWQRHFGGDRKAIGRNIDVDSKPRAIVGVMPRGFRFDDSDWDIAMPFRFERSKVMLGGFGFRGVARLKPGVTIAQADADIARLVPVWMNSWPMPRGLSPKVYEAWRITPAMRPLKDAVVGNVGDVLWVLMATIGIVLLIASANVANLLLVRAEARRQELAIRAALGAGSGRIVRELLFESTLLGVLGGALGLALAYAGLRLFVAIGPGNLPRLNEVSIDATALVFTFAVSVLSGLLFGLIPALKYAGPRIASALHSAGRTSSASRDRHHARNTLVVVQVAMALVLLVSAGLMIRTFQSLRTVEPGFTRPDQLQTTRVSIPFSLVQEPERVVRMHNDIADKLAAIPGATAVAFASDVPMEGGTDWDAVCTEGRTITASEIPPLRAFKMISPGLLKTMGTRLVAGRDYTWSDVHSRRPYVMVSENLAREFWGSPAAAVGKRITTCLPGAPLREVIGIVQDVRGNGVHEPAPATVYWPAFGESKYRPKDAEVLRSAVFIIRSDRAGSESLLRQLSEAVWSVNASLPLASTRTMQEIYDKSMARTSFTLVMLSIASGMALLLGIIGIYGVISYAVSQRRREIGIRLALGAQQRELKRMFVRHALTLAAIGVAIGLGAAIALSRLMKSLLFEISPLDPLTYAIVPVVLIAAAVLASYLPARRAATVDPVEALKAE